MKRLIPVKLAGSILLLSLALLAVLHVLILFRVVPAGIVWGGQIGESPGNLVVLETIALLVTLLFALIVAVKAGFVRTTRFRRATGLGMWLVFAYFVLNTLGNLASGVTAERLLFTPITILMALLALRLALEKSLVEETHESQAARKPQSPH